MHALEVQVNEGLAKITSLEADVSYQKVQNGILLDATKKANKRAEALAKDCAILCMGKWVTIVNVNNHDCLARDELASFKNKMKLSFKNLNDQHQMPAP